jgi:pimeloyl-ACP methyl ester carboxylesterase
MEEPARFTMPDGRLIAYRFIAGRAPAIVFLPGYMSDMSGGKATALFEWARDGGQACLLLDYSGCGASSGAFSEGTLTRWRDEVLALIETTCLEPVVLIGSSMGGWLMLLAALQLGRKVAGLIGLAAAPDFTEWGYDEAQKSMFRTGETVLQANPYGPEPSPTHAGFWADGQANLVLDGTIALSCPVRLLHGQKDDDVPWQTSLRLAATVHSSDVQVTLIKDGDHRLSRDSDIALLLRTVAAMVETGP